MNNNKKDNKMKKKVNEKQILRAVLSWLVKRGLPLSLAAAVLVALTGCPNPSGGNGGKEEPVFVPKEFNATMPNPGAPAAERRIEVTNVTNVAGQEAKRQTIEDMLNSALADRPSGPAGVGHDARFGNVFGPTAVDGVTINVVNSGMGNYKLIAETVDEIKFHIDFFNRTPEKARQNILDMVRNMNPGGGGVEQDLPFQVASSQGRALERLAAAGNTKFMVTQGCLS